MITLRADNRVLTANSKFAYLVQNYASGAATVDISNTEPFIDGSVILLSEMGQTDAEVMNVLSISGQTVTLADNTASPINTTYSHPESTRMIVLPYDQIRFFWTPLAGGISDENPEFDDSTPLTDWTTLDPSSYYTTYSDPGHSTGFGWFMYRNFATSDASQPSNPIPYAGFSMNTVQQVFADFDSLLNTNELKLVSVADKFSWLNEALATLKNKLNLTNVEYTVSAPQTITTVAGQAETMLPDNFSDIVEITDNTGFPVDFVDISDVMTRNGQAPQTVRYYLRNRYIGFSPTPTADGDIYYYTYRDKAMRATSLSTYIDLPDNAFYSLKDWMMYRAYMKFNNPLATAYYQSFKNAVDLYMQSAVKRSANLDTWGISPSANA